MTDVFRVDSLEGADLPRTFGDFELLRELGEGAMGRVFSARRLGDGEVIALKVLQSGEGREFDEFRRALDREAHIGEMLEHPGIVRVLQHGETEGAPWLAMELVDGLPLDRALNEGSLPGGAAVLELGIQIAEALHCAHTLEDGGKPVAVVHRDLKPSNVLLSRGGRAKLTDFGIAKAAALAGMTTTTGQTRGSPRYMSPEQTRGLTLDGRSDLFSLGSLLFEVCTGRQLFEGDSLIEVMTAIVSAERTLSRPGLFDAVNARVPGLTPVLRRCLRVEKNQRFATGTEVAQALRALRPAAPDQDLAAWISERLGLGAGDGRSERSEWESFENEVRLSDAALDSVEALRAVSEADVDAFEAETADIPPDPEPETEPEVDTARTPPKPAAPSGAFAQTEKSPIPVPPALSMPGRVAPGPNPFAELQRTEEPPKNEATAWWWLVGLLLLLALGVLWWALGR